MTHLQGPDSEELLLPMAYEEIKKTRQLDLVLQVAFLYRV